MSLHKAPRKVCFVVSTAMTVNAFLQEPIKILSQENEIYVAANLNKTDLIPVIKDTNRLLFVPLERKVSLYKDIVAVISLIKLFRVHQFDIVHSMTPKAGLIVMLASFLAGVKVRIHTFTGQVWYTRTGVRRRILKFFDKVASFFASHILVDSPTQRDFLLSEGVISNKNTSVLGKGSVCGVDLNKFKPNPAARNTLRSELGFGVNDEVILFLGRLSFDKGILDLVSAFIKVQAHRPSVKLLIVGPDEEDLLGKVNDIAKNCMGSIRHVGFTNAPQDYMAASDLLCLPSYREGFGGVVIEAAAVGIPAVGSRIYGLMDSIAENESGLLFEARNVSALIDCLMQLVENKSLRLKLGQNARDRVKKHFSSSLLAAAWLDYYRTKL
tara:strand:- start:305 stop:1453 length:1149 start_codon:yes stop_codon:yes gene_type:complete